MTEILNDIVTRSETPPVIILQADHGMRMRPEERMAILNAYYLPAQGNPALYESITPVNSFRVVFNTYFGAPYSLLEDKSYLSSYTDPYTFEIVPNLGSRCAP